MAVPVASPPPMATVMSLALRAPVVVPVVVGAGPAPRRAAAAGLGRSSNSAATPVGRRAASHGILLPCLVEPILGAAASGVFGLRGRLAAPPESPGFVAPPEERFKR